MGGINIPLKTVQITDPATNLVANVIATNGQNGLVTMTPGHVSTDNSTAVVLAGGATYTGTWEDITNIGVIVLSVIASHASATDGLMVEFSSDGTNVDGQDDYTIPAATGKTFSFQASSQYFRVKYTNGGTLQTYFRLQTVLKPYYVKPSSHRINDSIVGEDDSELVKAVLTGLAPDTSFKNVNVTDNGDLKVANTESGLSIAKGDVSGTTADHKFGEAPDFDISDGFVTIWDGANDAGIDAMTYTYSSTADIDSIVSSNGADAQDIEIIGLNSSGALTTQTATLNGQTRVALGTSLKRVFRMINRGSTDIAGVVSCYVNSSITGGVVDDKTKVRAIINDGNNQTLMAIYTVPTGKTLYMRDWYASLTRKKTASSTIRLFARPTGEVFQLKHTTDIRSDGTSSYKHEYVDPLVFAAGTDIEMRADTSADTNGIAAGFDFVLVDD